MKEREAIVTNVQRFSLDDGPGVRTTVFFKGCPLSCRWCHNPECILPHPQLRFEEKTCLNCGACMESCHQGVHSFIGGRHRIDFAKCAHCGACVARCWTGSLTIEGREYGVEALFEEIMRDEAFFRASGGGVTFSGGEPLLQADFLARLMPMLKRSGVSQALDTCGMVEWSQFERLLPHADLVLYDIKAMDPELHRRLTGARNDGIIDNLKRLDGWGIPIWIRMPVVRGINDDREMLTAAADLLSKLRSVRRVEILPFHRYGQVKYGALGRVYTGQEFEAPGAGELEEIREIVGRSGIETTVSNI